MKELSRYITLDPVHMPISVRWVEGTMGIANDRTPGPTDRYFIAILEYDAVDGKDYFNFLRKEKVLDNNSATYYKDPKNESWYPKSVLKNIPGEDNAINTKFYVSTIFTRNNYKQGWYFLTDDWKVFIYFQTT